MIMLIILLMCIPDLNTLQQDLGGELFSLGELFPTEDCEGKFLNFVPAFEPGRGSHQNR